MAYCLMSDINYVGVEFSDGNAYFLTPFIYGSFKFSEETQMDILILNQN